MPGPESPQAPQSRFGATSTGSPRTPAQKGVPDSNKSVLSNGYGDNDSQAPSNGEEDDVQTEVPVRQPGHAETRSTAPTVAGSTGDTVPNVEETEAEGTVPNVEETEAAPTVEEDDGEDVVPLGSVNSEGAVVDREGHVVGHVDGEVPSGSIVDTEGDVLDSEGNVIGRADVSQAAEKTEPSVAGDTTEASVPGDATEKTADLEKPESALGSAAPKVDEAEKAKSAAGSAVPDVEKPESALDSGAPEAEAPEVEAPEAEAPEVEAPVTEKPDLAGPFGVQDNGEVTNASGVPIGKLAEGDPVDLVGRSIKDIDSQGNLQATSGSVLGKVELNSEVLGKGEEALDKVDEEDEATEKGPVPTVLNTEGEAVPKSNAVPTELNSAGEKIEKPEAGLEEVPAVPEGEEAVEDAKANVPEGQEALDEAASKAPTDAGLDKAEDAAPDVEGALDESSPAVAEGEEALDESAVPKDLDDAKSAVPDAEGAVDEAKPEVPDAEGAVDEAKPEVAEGEEALDESAVPKDLDDAKSAVPDAEGAVDEAKPEVAEGEEALDESAVPKDLEDSKSAVPEGEAVVGDATHEVPAEGDVEGDVEDAAPPLDYSILKGMRINKLGKIVNDKGVPIGQVVEGDIKKLQGKKVDGEGRIWNDAGKQIGQAEPFHEIEDDESAAPFEDFPDSICDAKGNVIFEGKIVGKVIEGDAKKLDGKKVDADGDILDKHGNTLGKAERYQEEEPVPEEEPEPEVEDVSALEGKKVNKAGNVVDDHGKLFGRVIEGVLAKLIGKKCDAEGKIWGESGSVIGRAELLPLDERDSPGPSPFEDFPESIIDAKGWILFQGQIVGKLIEGDAKKLAGKKIDKDGECLDSIGNVLGKAERWTEPDEPEEEVIDNSALAGKRVNKVGNVVDSNGQIYGRLVEGDPKKLAGKMCDKFGNVKNEQGDTIGRAELVPEAEREGEKTGPFADFDNPTVTKDGKVADERGNVIGRVIEGDAKQLFGKPVDADGDVLDKNGNALGHAERWEEPEVVEEPEPEVEKLPFFGRKVNKKGEVVDDDGDIIARLTDGDLAKCTGKTIDNDGDVVDAKGTTVGHVSLLEDIPEPEESAEDKGIREQQEADKELADKLIPVVQGGLEQVKPVLNLISSHLDKANRTSREELDKEELVNTVQPLVEEGEKTLGETKATISALDPDSRIITQAKLNAQAHKATPEEYRLADLLKEQKQAQKIIDNAKVALEDWQQAEPEPEEEEEEETEEEKEERRQIEQDRKLAGQLAAVVEQSIDKIKPILGMIDHAISVTESQPEAERDEQKLVDTVKPLLEEGGQILQECNGAIRALDPDGRIQNQAKHQTAGREASPEEHHLAEQLKELSSSVMTAIERAKKKIAGMPHAKKELNPLWNLLAEPLGQIIAAVGLLLSGVLGLVGRLLSGLGLGGLLDNLLGGLGIKGILKGLGLGMITESLTGKK